jgi:hypothetical protein
MPFVNGTWVDDATSVPDPSMPQGMGDPTGAIVSAPQQTPMAPPQQINPRPIPGATPQLGGPPPISPMLLNPGDPRGANIQPGPVSPELTPGMVNQEWAKINRPPEWDAGRIASTIAKLPVTLPIQLIEGVRGLLGGDTIQGWAEQADARYSDPNYSESRAFGVKGIAKEPDYGDRWTGIITGKSQEGALHGKLMRQEIGRYTKQRSSELKDFKYVGDIYQQSQNLYKTGKELEFLPEEQQMKRDRTGAYLRSSRASAALSEHTLQKQRDDEATVAQLANALSADPSLADGNHTSALMAIAKGNLNLVKQALEVHAAGLTMPDASTRLTPAQSAPLVAGVVKDLAAGVTTDLRDENTAIGAAGAKAQDQARADEIRQQDQIRADAIRNQEATATALAQARKNLDEAYSNRELQMPSGGGFLGMGGTSDKDKLDFLTRLGQEKSRVRTMLDTGVLSPIAAQAIGGRTADDDEAIQRMLISGEIDPDAFNAALEGKYPVPTPAPTPLATPVPPIPTRAVPTPRPAGELPSSQGNAALQELVDRLIGKPRPTPMATPSPTPSRAGAGTMSEDARRANADRLARFTPQFQAKWQAQHPDKPMRGPLYESEFKRNATANGIVVESLQ